MSASQPCSSKECSMRKALSNTGVPGMKGRVIIHLTSAVSIN